ncbi:hypothetical protein [Microcystis aeruginosa]|uniref:hypothetical protein n=1 Tax=Microcystis aeruginosa TaxID=1126 RepID=UPI0012DAB932|nr:hypothetical protein [Microcystis aeruginosa]
MLIAKVRCSPPHTPHPTSHSPTSLSPHFPITPLPYQKNSRDNPTKLLCIVC